MSVYSQSQIDHSCMVYSGGGNLDDPARDRATEPKRPPHTKEVWFPGTHSDMSVYFHSQVDH